MPNHCSNRVSFYSDDTTAILKLHEIFSRGLDENDERTVFGAFIPEPDWKNTPLAESDQYQYSFSSKRGELGELPVESGEKFKGCLLYTSPSPRDSSPSRMPSSA